MAKKKAQRTTHRSVAGNKLYAKRNAEGQITDIQTYKRAHSQDMKRVSAAEAAARALAHPTPDPSVKLPGLSLPIPVPGAAGSPVTGAPTKSTKAKPAVKSAVTAKPAAPKSSAAKTKPVKAAAKKSPAKPVAKPAKKTAKAPVKKVAKKAAKKKK